MIEIFRFFGHQPGVMLALMLFFVIALAITGRVIVTCSRHFWMYMACRHSDNHVYLASVKEMFKERKNV
jgi:hypothetical protein